MQADLHLAGDLGERRRYAEAWAIRLRALDQARELKDNDLIFTAARMFLINQQSPHHESEALELAKEFAVAPNDGVSSRTLAGVLFFAGRVLLQYGERSRAEELFAQVNELATRTRDAQLLLFPSVAEISAATLGS